MGGGIGEELALVAKDSISPSPLPSPPSPPPLPPSPSHLSPLLPPPRIHQKSDCPTALVLYCLLYVRGDCTLTVGELGGGRKRGGTKPEIYKSRGGENWRGGGKKRTSGHYREIEPLNFFVAVPICGLLLQTSKNTKKERPEISHISRCMCIRI